MNCCWLFLLSTNHFRTVCNEKKNCKCCCLWFCDPIFFWVTVALSLSLSLCIYARFLWGLYVIWSTQRWFYFFCCSSVFVFCSFILTIWVFFGEISNSVFVCVITFSLSVSWFCFSGVSWPYSVFADATTDANAHRHCFVDSFFNVFVLSYGFYEFPISLRY